MTCVWLCSRWTIAAITDTRAKRDNSSKNQNLAAIRKRRSFELGLFASHKRPRKPPRGTQKAPGDPHKRPPPEETPRDPTTKPPPDRSRLDLIDLSFYQKRNAVSQVVPHTPPVRSHISSLSLREISHFGGLGSPGSPRRPFQKVGGFAPNLLQGSPGPKMTDLRSLKCFLNMLAIQSAAT